MSFGDGNLHEQIDKLKVTNGALCAEINRQERVIEDLNNALAIEHRYFEVTRERWTKRGVEIARQRELIANRDESIHNLVKVLDKRQERIKALESLVLDWAMAPCAVCDPWDEHFACEHFDGHDCTLGIRMSELGIEVGE